MLKKFHKAQGGFTLVELLVTIAILAVLFGIVTLTLTGVGSDAEDTVNAAEKAVVQSAIDIHMADNNLGTITAKGTAACLDGTEVLFDDSDGTTDDTIGQYLRLETSSQCEYSWTQEGLVSQANCTCK